MSDPEPENGEEEIDESGRNVTQQRIDGDLNEETEGSDE
jgi:hypothetical protein